MPNSNPMMQSGGRVHTRGVSEDAAGLTVHKDRWGLDNYTRSKRLGYKRTLACHSKRRAGRNEFVMGERLY